MDCILLHQWALKPLPQRYCGNFFYRLPAVKITFSPPLPHALHLNRARYGLAWLRLSCLGETMTTTMKETEKQKRWQTICERERTKKYNFLQQPFTTERCRRRHRATGAFCFCFFFAFWRATATRWVINTGATFWLWKCNILRGGNAGKHPQQVL